MTTSSTTAEPLRPSLPSALRVAFYETLRYSLAVFFTLLYRARALHATRVPRHGPIIIAANHLSHLDPPFIGVYTRRRLSFVARSGLFRNRFFGLLISLLNAIPIRENAGDAAAIKEILRRIRLGEAVLIFPEGSRSPDGSVQPFKRGIALLVKRAECPVLPVAVEGCFDAWPRHRALPRLLPPRIAVNFGNPIPHDELMKDGPDAALERIRREVEALREELARFRRDPGPRHAATPAPAHGSR